MNGNTTTALMHLVVWNELHRLRVNNIWPITQMGAEEPVTLSTFSGRNGFFPAKKREGRFDFLVKTPEKNIGFEVLTRPSKGKMIRKMSYSNEVDEFVFVLPMETFDHYRITPSIHGWKTRPRKLPSIFGKKGLFAWRVDLEEQRIISKTPFGKLFYVEENTDEFSNRREHPFHRVKNRVWNAFHPHR